MHRRTLLGAALGGTALAISGSLPAYGKEGLPPLKPDQLRAAIEPLGEDVSGALVRVEGDAGRWRGRAGVDDLRTRRPVPWDARFRIGSMTKLFTAATVFQLAEAGLVDLDAPVRRYLPERLPLEYAGTVRQLLDHTHGLQGVALPHKNWEWFREHRFDTFAPGSQVRWEEPPPFTPGTRQQYGNTGYIVLGLVIERATGRPYADAVRRGVLRPLGLRNTFLPGTATHIPGPHARGYELVGTEYVDITRANPSLQWSAAEVISTTGDLDRLLTALLGGGLLARRWQRAMLTVPDAPTWAPGTAEDGAKATYGAGPERLEIGGLVLWGKTGDRPGYNNGVGATPDLRRRLTYSVNTVRMGGDMPVTAQRIVQAALS